MEPINWDNVQLKVKVCGAWGPVSGVMLETLRDYRPDDPLTLALIKHEDHQTAAYYTGLGYLRAHCTTCDREIWNRDTES